MKRTQRLVEIEKLWKSKPRSIDWEQVTWEPFTFNGHQFNLKFPRVEEAIADSSPAAEGYYFWSWGFKEEASGTLDWDWALMHLLHTWYLLPEDCDAPLFVNERAMAVCIPNSSWADSLALLFQHPASVLLGMEDMKAEREVQEAARNAKYEADALARAEFRGLNPNAALAFLYEDDEPTESTGTSLPSTTEIK